MTLRRAAVVLVPNATRVLAVSRPEPPLRYALPGGGVDFGESYEDAARRELWEETGLIADKLVRVHADKRVDHYVVAFVEVGLPSGELRSSREGWARWVDPRVVTCPGAAWPEFSREVFRAAGILLPRCT